MSANEENEEIPVEVAEDSTEAVTTEPTGASESAASNEVNAQTVESSTASVDEAKPPVPDQKENSEPRLNSHAHLRRNPFTLDLMKASNLHCPFVWRNDLDPSMYLDHELDILSSAEEMFDDSGFRFRRYIVHLVLCYHNFYKRNIKDCMKHLDELDNMMKLSSKRHNSDYLFNTINEALFHVILSCRIYILDTTDQKDRTKEILKKIKSYDALSDANKAGLWAIRANVYVEYGYEGVKSAVSYMRKAVSIDPENAFWHFMKGMFMGRLRRIEGGQIMPENEEFFALRTAIEKREDPAFLAIAGEAYLETAKTAKRLLTNDKSDKDSNKQAMIILQNLNEVAAKYFKRSIELKPTSSHLLFRCGKGLINLPPPYQDLKMGLDFLRKGLEIAPDSGYGNHAMATFLDKIEKKPRLAKEYLDISIKNNNFPAHLDMIRIEFLESNDAQKLWEELEKMLAHYNEMPRRRRILGELVCYRLFIDYDLVEACYFMKKLVAMNSTSVDVINSHKSMILPVAFPIPLSDLIFNRIQASLKDRKLGDLSRTVFAKYIQFLIDQNIEPNQVNDEVFAKVKRQIEVGFKNRQIKPVDERAQDAHRRVRGAHDFGVDPCAEEELGYLDFYKDDLKDTKVGKTRGVGDEMMNMLQKMGQNPLPKRRFDEHTSAGDRREREDGSSRRGNHERERSGKHSESSRSSREHRRRRSYSSSSSSRSSSSSSDRSSTKRYQSSRRRRRSSSYSSSFTSSSSSSSDRYSKSRRRKDRRRRSSSYDSRRGRDKHRREVSPDARSRRQKKGKHNRSPSSSTYSSSETSTSSRRQRSRKETDSQKPKNVPASAEVAPDISHPAERLTKTDVEITVDQVQAIMDNLSIDGCKSSRCGSPQPIAADASKDMREVAGAKSSSQNGETSHSGDVEGSNLGKKSGKRENREDSDGSVKTMTSRASGASKRSSKRRSRDRSVDSVRTTSSRSSKRRDKSSRKRSSSSSSRSSSREVVGAKNSSQNGEASNSGDVEGSNLVKKSGKRENREDSDGSVKTMTSRASGASKRSSKRRSRDRSVDSVRTTSSRLSKKRDKASRKRSSSSSSRSSSRDRSSERSSGRRHRRLEQGLINSPDLIERCDSATANRSERRSKDSDRRDGSRKHSSKHERREDASDSNADSSSRRDHRAKNGRADRRSLSRESKYSKDEERRPSRKEEDDRS